MSLLKQSTARSRVVFMADSSDHVTGKTGLTLTITASKDGAAFGSITPVVTELATGWYKLALTTAHTDTLGDLAIHITSTGADPTDLNDQVVTDLPGASVSSVSGAVGSVTSGVTVTTNNDKTGYALSAAAVQAIWDALTSALTTVGSVGKLLVDKLDATVSSRMATFTLPSNFSSLVIDSTGRVNAFLIGILTTVFTEGATGRVAGAFKQFFNIASPAATMDHGILVDTATTLTNAPSDSSGVTTLLSRVPSGIFTGMTSLAQWLGAMAGKQTANSTARTEIRATGAGSGTFDETTDANEAIRDRGDAAYLTATSVAVSDKTGFSLSAAGVQAIWDALTSALTTVGSIGKRLVDDLTGDIYARLGAPAGASVSADVAAVKAVLPSALVSGRIDASVGAMASGVLTATAIAADAITDAKVASDVTIASVTGAVGSVTGAVGSVTGAVGSVTGNVGGNVVGSVASVTAGVTLAASAVQAIWDALTSALTTVGSIGKLLVDKIDATISSRLASSGYTAPDNSGITSIKTQTDKLAFTVTNQVDANVLDWKSSTAPAMTGDAFARLGAPAGASVSADVAAVKAVDDAVKLKTDTLPASPAATGDAMTLTSGERASIAAALLDLANGVETGMTPRQALRIALSVLAGKLSGADTNAPIFRDVNDTKDRVTATTTDDGNRTAVTVDAT